MTSPPFSPFAMMTKHDGIGKHRLAHGPRFKTIRVSQGVPSCNPAEI